MGGCISSTRTPSTAESYNVRVQLLMIGCVRLVCRSIICLLFRWRRNNLCVVSGFRSLQRLLIHISCPKRLKVFFDLNMPSFIPEGRFLRSALEARICLPLLRRICPYDGKISIFNSCRKPFNNAYPIWNLTLNNFAPHDRFNILDGSKNIGVPN